MCAVGVLKNKAKCVETNLCNLTCVQLSLNIKPEVLLHLNVALCLCLLIGILVPKFLPFWFIQLHFPPNLHHKHIQEFLMYTMKSGSDLTCDSLYW